MIPPDARVHRQLVESYLLATKPIVDQIIRVKNLAFPRVTMILRSNGDFSIPEMVYPKEIQDVVDQLEKEIFKVALSIFGPWYPMVSAEEFWDLMHNYKFVRLGPTAGKIEDQFFHTAIAPEQIPGFIEDMLNGIKRDKYAPDDIQ